MEFLYFIALVWILFWCKSLSNRISALENRESSEQNSDISMFKKVTPPTPPNPTPPTQVPTVTIAPALGSVSSEPITRHVERTEFSQVETDGYRSPESAVVSEPERPNPVIEWFSDNTLIKTGALLFFMGAVWFVSYAIGEGWISPFFRILGGILLGILVSWIGWLRRDSNAEHYLVLSSLGVSIGVASIYAGQLIFSLFSTFTALTLTLVAIGYALLVSFRSNTEWLAVVCTLLALVAPYIAESERVDPLLFLVYLLSISVGFLGVVFATNWRAVTLVLTCGVGLALGLVYGGGELSHGVLWFFVVLYSLLFFGATTVSMVRSNAIVPQDITALCVSMFVFLGFAYAIAPLAGLATFIAALVCASTGYVLHEYGRSERLIAVYAALSVVLTLVATAFTFDGYARTMLYVVEIACALVLSMRLGLHPRVTQLSAWLFAIPVVQSLTDITAPEWHVGAWHGSAVALYALTAATATVCVHALRTSRVRTEPVYKAIGGVFAVLFWFYACTVFWLVPHALFTEPFSTVFTYVMWAGVSSVMTVAVLHVRLSFTWLAWVLSSFAAPIFLSLSSFADPLWHVSVFHASALGLYFMTLLTLVFGIWFVASGRYGDVPQFITSGGVWFALFWFYMIAVPYVFWNALFVEDVAHVLTYVTWVCVSYGLVKGALISRIPESWLAAALGTLIVPVTASLISFSSTAWADSWTHIDAIGLYAVTSILALIAQSLSRAHETASDIERSVLGSYRTLTWCTVGLYMVAEVWHIAHAVIASTDAAVSAALFVYTISGLGLYTIGRVRLQQGVRYAGIALLGGVVVRLLLIDVWDMNVLGKTITFLGIGCLFMLTALFERPFQKDGSYQ